LFLEEYDPFFSGAGSAAAADGVRATVVLTLVGLVATGWLAASFKPMSVDEVN
jgi:hypothetical protein